MDLTKLLMELIAIPSVNPMGNPDVDPAVHFETRMADFLAKWFTQRGMEVERHLAMPATGFAPDRECLLAGLPDPDKNGKPLILLEAHMDTVPVDGMTVDPFAAEIRDGRIFGRGACDEKGSIACLLATAARILEIPDGARPHVVFAFSANEEFGFDGAKKLREIWSTDCSQLLKGAPDAVIVCEPTELNVVTAHKGIVRWRIRTKGRACHSSAPSNGENAIYAMSKVIAALEQYHQTALQTQPSHAILGFPSLSVGTIRGGVSVSVVPDECTIEIDRRLNPAEDPSAARMDVIQFLEQHVPEASIEHDAPFMVAPGLSEAKNTKLARSLLEICQSHAPGAETTGVAFGTDAAFLGQDVPCVVFGPGSIAQAHTCDEWIAIEQLALATEILTAFVGA